MSVLFYIIRKRFKNTFLEMLHKPGKLITWIIVILIVVFNLVVASFNHIEPSETIPIYALKWGVFIYTTMFIIIGVKQGLSSGGTMFEMNDVNFLFTSPIDPRKILLYGVLQMGKTALLASFFLLFQGNTFNLFGVRLSGLFLVIAGFAVGVCLMQIGAMVIYCLTNGRPKRKRVVRIAAAAVFLPMAVYLVVALVKYGDFALAMEQTINSPAMTWIPAIGWATEGPFAFYSGRIGDGLICFGLCFIAIGLLENYLLRSRVDYYEDVLVATETAFEKKREMAEGNLNMRMVNKEKKVRVAATGIGGMGASTFLHKHLREDFRESRLGPWGLKSLLLIVMIAVYGYFTRDLGVLTGFTFLLLMQTMFVGNGRGLVELYSPYIYLLPERPLTKMIWINGELMIKALGESILLAIVFAVVYQISFPLLVMTSLAYLIYTFQLIGLNYVSLRFTGVNMSAGLTIIIYFILQILIVMPGIVIAILVSVFVPQTPLYLLIGIFTVWELLVGLVVFGISSKVIHNCDMPVMKPKST
jgi:hypothetical protein